ncbi:ribosomal protein S18 acetylase RimI-like enzyme [Phycicoccus badiiscoriae]|uniref:Ribosomal protein S18 acetylase RimI-like enzyme n=1 Tax=Pedococcus badiiscoriae TaxID=642776 RepID=A0A852WL53_9MICO|nr:ribosomal protein S18 acetylase RimI-like enzyme [Pedococcus badiiscoriae]
MGVVVRRAASADSEVLAEVAAATFALACPPHITQRAIDTFIAEVLSQACFDAYLADPQRDLFLSVEDGAGGTGGTPDTVTGYAMVVHGEPTDADVQTAITLRPTAELSKIYVLPDHHGAGTSRQLMGAALEAARDRGAVGVWLGVNQQNERAQRFYLKSGFARVGTKRFLVGDRYEHDYVFERAL